MFKSLTLTGKLVVAALAALFVAAVVFGIYTAWTAKPKAEARLGKNTTEAAVASGKDAVNTVGAAGDREAASADLDRANAEEIRNAEGSGDAVNPAVHGVGLRSLCQRAAYRERAECVQFASPR